jgi:transcriptional regulator with XRE-family HTH domain
MGPSVAQASRVTRTQANRLRAVRVAAGVSQRRLAAEAGIARLTIQRTERGETQPTPATLAVLAAALGVEPMALVNDPPQGAAGVDDG